MTTPQDDDGPLDEAAFLREVFAAMRGAGMEPPFPYDPATGMFGDDERGRIDLRALHSQVGAHPRSQRDGALKKVAEFFVERPSVPADWGYAKPRIALTFVQRVEVVEHEVRSGADAKPWPTAPITPHAGFGLGYPISLGTINVGVEAVERWGVTLEQAFRQAAANLEKRSRQPWMKADHYPGVHGSPWQDGFDACRLFFPGKFSEVGLRGPPVVLLPTPRRMLFAGADDEEGLANLARLARTYVDKGEGTLFLRPLRLRADGMSWEDWLPPEGHLARHGLRWMQARQEVIDWGRYAWAVRHAGQGAPLDAAPAEMGLLEADPGPKAITAAFWDDGGPTALPSADLLVFRRGGEVLGSAPWARVAERAPDLLEDAPGYPPRWIGRAFPDDALLARIGLDPAA